MLWTERETARRLGISPRTLRRWRDDGIGPDWIRLRQPHGSVRYDESAVRRWVREQTRRMSNSGG